MKYSIQFFTLTFINLLFVASNMLNAQVPDRNIYFAHGLKGDVGSWKHYTKYVKDTRKANTLTHTYDENNGGIAGAAIQTAGLISSNMGTVATNPSNMAIGHSQGSHVLRSIDRNIQGTAKPFGGFITVGGPNNGAQVLNSMTDGTVQKFNTDACTELFAGPPAILLNSFANWLGIVPNDKICDFLGKIATEKIVGAYMPSTTTDYTVGSPYLTSLQQYNSTIPRMAIVSTETAPHVQWKVAASYTITKPTDLAFEVVDDTKLVTGAQVAQAVYFGLYVYHSMLSSYWLLPQNFFNYHENKAQGYMRGVVWFSESEAKWNKVIGALTINTVAVTVNHCDCLEQYQCAMNPAGCNAWSDIIYNTTTTSTTSDGVVTIPSQSALPGACRTITLLGPNHAEERNHPEITGAFNTIFKGSLDMPFDAQRNWFKTDLR
jgi:hypothetical protein